MKYGIKNNQLYTEQIAFVSQESRAQDKMKVTGMPSRSVEMDQPVHRGDVVHIS